MSSDGAGFAGADLGGGEPGSEGSNGTSPGNEGQGSEEAARAICLRLLTAGPRTRAQLATALRKRRIPDGEVRSAVGLLGPQDELATARRLVARRLPASRGKPTPARARQLMGMLARKGYSAGLAAQVVREALEQEQESDAGHGADLAWISEDGAGDDWL